MGVRSMDCCKCVRERKGPIDHGYLNCLSAPGKVKWSSMDVNRWKKLVVMWVSVCVKCFGVALPGEAPECNKNNEI